MSAHSPFGFPFVLLPVVALGLTAPIASRSAGPIPDCPRSEVLYPSPYASAPTPPVGIRLATGDVDGDGFIDLAATFRGATGSGSNPDTPGELRIYFGGSTEFLSDPLVIASDAGTWGLGAGDLDGDGRTDFLFSNIWSGVAHQVRFPNGRIPIVETLEARISSRPLLADIDGDGRSDLASVTARYFVGEIDIFISAATGFRLRETIVAPNGSDPMAVAFGNFDGDNRPDLFSLATGLFVARNLGDSFAAWQSIDPSFGWQLLLADLDGDGLDDMVEDRGFSGGVVQRLSRGGGSFQPVGKPEYWAKPLAAGDVDGDGTLDLISDRWLLRGQGLGAYDLPIELTIADRGKEIVTSDFNGDGLDDVASISEENSINVVWGRPGSFEPPGLVPLDVTPRKLLRVDIDADGLPDLFTLAYQGIHFYPALGLASFGPGVVVEPDGVVSFGFANLNGDGHFDLIENRGYALRIRLADPQGGWAAGRDFPLRTGASGWAVGDLDEDGWPDIAAVGEGDYDDWGRASGIGWVEVFWNDGAAKFTRSETIDTSLRHGGVTLADVTGDSRPEILTSTSLGLTLYEARPGWGFLPAVGHGGPGFRGGPTVVDLNADGVQDIITIWSGIAVRLGTGPGEFASAVTYPAEYSVQSGNLADLNGDGWFDLVVPRPAASSIGLLLGDGQGGFACRQDIPVGPAPLFAVPADVDGDGRLDLLTGPQGAGFFALMNQAGMTTPIRLTGFTATTTPRGVELTWTAADERPVQFRILRAPTDAAPLDVIGQVDGAANTFNDSGPLSAGIYRYALEAVERSGALRHLGEIQVRLEQEINGDARLAAWPVPGRGPLQVSWTMAGDAAVLMQIFDTTGRLIAVRELGIVGPGVVNHVWDARDDGGAPVPPGIYFLRLKIGRDEERVIRIIRV
jgi:hypothetical protein